MTIAGYDSVYVITLAINVFGALTFSVLILHYWRRTGTNSRRDPVFAAFTMVCAAAFAINVLARVVPQWESGLSILLDVTSSFVAPILFQLVCRNRGRALTATLYVLGLALAAALILDDLSIVALPLRDQAPAILLAAVALLGLALVDRTAVRRLRLWYRLLLALLSTAAVTGTITPSTVTTLAPDYLLLAFFCVTLYYRERLIFFDLLIKRGVLFGFAVATLAAILSLVRPSDRLTTVLLLTPLLLVMPWVDALLGRLVDRLFLRRKYSPEEAERVVQRELQMAAGEDDLRSRAQRCLSEVFGSVANIQFAWPPQPPSVEGLDAVMEGRGRVVLEPRPSGIPFMTEDRRLLDSLALILGVVLDNVRFREQQAAQQEREQQLRLLATRAELRALRAQINPHFLFNSLNAIAGFIPSRPDLADDAIGQLAQVFRYTLRRSEKEWARLDEEAEFAAAYLRLEKARFGERLEVNLAIDPAASKVSVPAMCVQPLIENAIRHGTSTLEGKGIVGLRIAVNGSAASIEVYDNGPGFPSGFSLTSSAGHGLRNVAERLQGYYGDSARLWWEWAGESTRVVLQVPVAAISEIAPAGAQERHS